MAVALAGIGTDVVLFPILWKQNEAAARASERHIRAEPREEPLADQ